MQAQPMAKALNNLTFLVTLFLLPVALLYSGLAPLQWRFGVGIAGFGVVLACIRADGLSAAALGLRVDNLRSSLLPYLVFTVAGVLAIALFAKLLGRTPRPVSLNFEHFRFYLSILLPICSLQELVYRGYLVAKLNVLCPNRLSSNLLNAALFSAAHIFYPQPELVLPLTFVGGIAFTSMYSRFPNLLAISISHAVLNMTAVMYCFVSFVYAC